MKKIINEPTHISGQPLDQLFIYSLDNQVTCSDLFIDSIHRLGSDHYPIFCKINLNPQKKYFKTINYRAINSMNADQFTADLELQLKNMKISGSFRASVMFLTESVGSILDGYAPFQTKTISVVDRAPWFDQEYRELRKLRRSAESKKNRSGTDYLYYKKLCTQANVLANKKKKDYLAKKVSGSSHKTRTLYKLVNRVLDRKQDSALPDNTGDLKQLSEDFNQYFIEKIDKIRNNIPLKSLPSVSDTPTSFLFEFEPTNESEIKTIIKESGVNCSQSDILPSSLYKDNLDIMLPTLVKLVNLSLSSGSMDGVKTADIIPLIKNDSLDSNVLKNYRPVSNLTFLGKLIERVVLKRLNNHLNRNGLDCPEQFAYKKNHSTETLLKKL